jgi:MFS family permease
LKTIPESSVPNHAVGALRSEALRDANGRIYGGWLAAFASMIGMALGPNCILAFCFGSFVMPLEREFGWGLGAISLGATLISAMIVVTSLIAGYLVDRVGCRKLVLGSMPLFAAGVAGLSRLNSNILVFYAALVLVSSLGLGVWHISYNKITASWFDRRLGLGLGVANAGIGIGAAVLPALVAVVIAGYGWRTAYGVLGILALVPWPIALFALKDAAPARDDRSSVALQAPDGLSMREASRTSEFWAIFAGFAIFGATSGTIVIHQVHLLVDSGMSAKDAGVLQSVLGIALIVGRLCTGWLLDRFRAQTIMSVLCLAASGALALFAAGSPYGSAAVSATVIGFVLGAELDVLGFLVRRYFGLRAFSMIYGVIFSGFQIGAAVSIAIVGLSRAMLGSYAIPLAVLAVAVFIAAVLFSRLKPYRFSAGVEGDTPYAGELNHGKVQGT